MSAQKPWATCATVAASRVETKTTRKEQSQCLMTVPESPTANRIWSRLKIGVEVVIIR